MPEPVLVIHAPQRRIADGARSFERVLETGVGVGYALTSEMSRLPRGTKVVLLRKDSGKSRAEGYLAELVRTGKSTANGRERYDVHIRDLNSVEYQPERLDRFGVNLLWI